MATEKCTWDHLDQEKDNLGFTAELTSRSLQFLQEKPHRRFLELRSSSKVGAMTCTQLQALAKSHRALASLWTALVSLQAGPTTARTLLPGPASPPDWDRGHLPLLEAAPLHGAMFHQSGWLSLCQRKALKSGFGHRTQRCLMRENVETDANEDFLALLWEGESGEEEQRKMFLLQLLG